MRNRWHPLLLVLVAVSAFGTALSAQEPRPRTDALEPGQPETPAAPLPGGTSDDANGALSVDGRYRIERISAESIEMAWADGTGRQLIRLSGS